MQNTENGKQYDFITLLSVMSSIAVVVLHTNGCFWDFSTDNYWKSANIIECIFYFGVPVFFMITGATLMDYQKRYSTKVYIKKRVNKTLIPFAIWSLIGLAVNIIVDKEPSLSEINLTYLINGFLGTEFIPIYWFFIPLFCVYASLPLFASVPDEKRKSLFSYLILAGFTVNVLIPFILSVTDFDIKWPNSLKVCSEYLLLALTGYILTKYDLNFKLRSAIYALGIAGLLMHIIGTYRLSIEAGEIVTLYKGYNNLPCYLYSVGIFVFVKTISPKVMKSHLKKCILFLGNYTFPVYLMHIYIKAALPRLLHISIYSLAFRLGAPLLIIPLCIIAAYFLRKIPVIKRIVP